MRLIRSLLVLCAASCSCCGAATFTARASSSSPDASDCASAILGHATNVTSCSNDGFCQSIVLSAATSLPEGFSSAFILESKGGGKYAITAMVDGIKYCVKPQMCGSRPSMYECSGFFDFVSKDAWRIIASAEVNSYTIVSDPCPSTSLDLWLPNTTSAQGCQLAFPNDPAGGACQPNIATGECDKITGSAIFDVWRISDFTGTTYDSGEAQKIAGSSMAIVVPVLLLSWASM